MLPLGIPKTNRDGLVDIGGREGQYNFGIYPLPNSLQCLIKRWNTLVLLTGFETTSSNHVFDTR